MGAAAPVWLMWTTIAATAVSGYAQYRQGQQQKKMGRYNAELARRQATDAVNRGQIAEQKHRRKVAVFMGQQRAATGASGVLVDSGSSASVLEDTAAMAELDALRIRENATREAWGYQARAEAYEFQGSESALAGTIGAGSTLAAGAASAYNVRTMDR